MSFVIVDVEADGPIPADYSMVCFGAVAFDEALDKSFYGQTRPISDRFLPEALAVSGFSGKEPLAFDYPKAVMGRFAGWLEEHSKGRPVFVSDNLAFDSAGEVVAWLRLRPGKSLPDRSTSRCPTLQPHRRRCAYWR